MKSCPTCNRTFEDTFSFCLIDGSVLSAPFEHQAIQRPEEVDRSQPPATEVIPVSEPPTEGSGIAAKQPPQLTIAAARPIVPVPSPPDQKSPEIGGWEKAAAQGQARLTPRSKWPMLAIGGLVIVGMIVVVVVLLSYVWPSSPKADSRRWLTMLSHRVSNTPAVLREVNAELARNPSNPLALRVRAAAYFISHQDEPAKRDLEEVERLLTRPESADDYEARCYSRRVLDRMDEALSDCARAIELDPQFFSAYYGRGRLYAVRKDYDRAIADSNQAIELNPKSAVAYFGRGRVFHAKKDYERALADFNKSIELDPQDADSFARRGLAYYEKKDYDRAISDYSKAIELDPQNATAYFFRGYTYLEKKDYDRAISDYSKAIELEPQNGSNYYFRGSAYHEKKDYDRAISDYSKAIELDPKDASAYGGRAWTYEALGDSARAAADQKKAEELKK